MDKKSIIALILIGIIILLIPYYQKLIQPPQQKTAQTHKIAKADSNLNKTQAKISVKKEIKKEEKQAAPAIIKKKETPVAETQQVFKNVEQANSEKLITIDNDVMHAVISNKGGGLLKNFTLKKYAKYDSSYVNFIDPKLNNNTFFAFIDKYGKTINTSNFLFNTNIQTSKKFIKENETYSIDFYIYYEGTKITRRLTFYGNRYHFDVQIKIKNPEKIMLNNQFEIGWKNGIPLTESYKRDDNGYSHAYVYMADELEDYKIKKEGVQKPLNLSGSASWLAIRTKYFLTSLMNYDKKNIIDGIYLGGQGKKEKEYVLGKYNVYMNARYNVNGSNTFRYYLGPLDYNKLKKYDNHLQVLVMNNGWYERTFRFFSLLILPILEFLHKFIPNYGLVIIVFSILIKLVLYPLTKKSYQSMREMQKIQPLMTELRAKYKDDPQRLNKEMMKLYKVHGVNPMGGCLPMLLQMPLLFALYIVFRSTIQLRGAPFIPGWINDLSRPEGLFRLPFSLPFYGNEFNILPILMAVTMIFQSKMTTQDPKQKAMIYIMPIFMLMIFNPLSSGLNLYYTMFNILTVIQQLYINRGLGGSKELAPATVSSKNKRKR